MHSNVLLQDFLHITAAGSQPIIVSVVQLHVKCTIENTHFQKTFQHLYFDQLRVSKTFLKWIVQWWCSVCECFEHCVVHWTVLKEVVHGSGPQLTKQFKLCEYWTAMSPCPTTSSMPHIKTSGWFSELKLERNWEWGSRMASLGWTLQD